MIRIDASKKAVERNVDKQVKPKRTDPPVRMRPALALQRHFGQTVASTRPAGRLCVTTKGFNSDTYRSSATFDLALTDRVNRSQTGVRASPNNTQAQAQVEDSPGRTNSSLPRPNSSE